MADILEQCAVDPTHQPAIYSAFIREIVRKTRESRAGESAPTSTAAAAASAIVNGTGNGNGNGSGNGDAHGTMDPTAMSNALYDPQLLGEAASWQPGDLMATEAAQFQFIPQGGDMMWVSTHPHSRSHPHSQTQLQWWIVRRRLGLVLMAGSSRPRRARPSRSRPRLPRVSTPRRMGPTEGRRGPMQAGQSTCLRS